MEKEKFLKPMTVARQEFIKGLADLINNSMLPPFVIEDVLKDTYNKMAVLSKQQLENDTKSYYEALGKAAASE